MMASTIIGGLPIRLGGGPCGSPSFDPLSLPHLDFLTVSSKPPLTPPFIATLGTMMISLGIGSIVSNVRSATFPPGGP